MTSELRQAFGLAVRIFRERRGWTQAQLEEAARLSRGHVGRVERGELDLGLGTQRRLADALGLTLVELMAQAEEEERRLQARGGQ